LEATDIAIWLLTGLVAGWLAGAVNAAAPRPGRLAVVGAGVAGGTVGGSIVFSLAATSAVAFLGAAGAAVATALAVGALLRRYWSRRYHE
jgi:uncharacterized membrane protein YeaQ/YmgE (transglycosylase-associated protein family)